MRCCSAGKHLLLNQSFRDLEPHGTGMANAPLASQNRLVSAQQHSCSVRRALCFVALVILSLLCAAKRAITQNQATQEPEAAANATEMSNQEILKDIQNPVADLISLPIQSNTNWGIAPYGRVQNIVTIEPIFPLNLSSEWILVTRIIQPLTWQPHAEQTTGGVFGLGDMNPTFFLSPRKAVKQGKLLWGVGPNAYIPTATSPMLGAGKLSLGPSVVVLGQPGPWTFGVLVSNVWSVAGSGGRARVNQMSLQYFLAYNLPHDWYLTSSPTITADWLAVPGNVWTVPFGMGVGKLVTIGKRLVDFSGTFYGNTATPAGMPPWSMSLNMTLVFSKPKGTASP